MNSRHHFLGLAMALAGVLAGCASPAQLPLGSSRAQVLGTLGQPTAEYGAVAASNSADRLQYSWQPAGQAVYNVDLSSQGQVTAVTQSLDEVHFARIEVDRWTQADVLREFGPPYRVEGVHAFNGVIWTWRYRLGPWDRLLHIYLDPQGVVRRWHPSDEPRYDRVFGGPMR